MNARSSFLIIKIKNEKTHRRDPTGWHRQLCFLLLIPIAQNTAALWWVAGRNGRPDIEYLALSSLKVLRSNLPILAVFHDVELKILALGERRQTGALHHRDVSEEHLLLRFQAE